MTLMDDRPAATGHVGRSLRRKEDPRLITGQATYVDDISITGMLHAAFVRSPEAQARRVETVFEELAAGVTIKTGPPRKRSTRKSAPGKARKAKS